MWLLDELAKLKDSNRLAIRQREDAVSFKELWNRSEALSAFLLENNVDHKPIVIYGDKEIDFVAVMHAALKTGVAYVPVDISYPVQRLMKIVDQVESDIIVNFSKLEVEINGSAVIDKCDVNDIYSSYADAVSHCDNWVKEDDICYILFTSGSTGEPKGVPISKGNLLNFTDWFLSFCKVKYDEYYAINQVSYSFDVSDICLYIYLPLGICLLNIDRKMARDMRLLFPYLTKYQAGVWISTSSFLELCIFDKHFDRVLMPKLDVVILAGEVLTKNLSSTIFERFEGVKLVNGYGPTEATVLLTACYITEEMLHDTKSLPIGEILSDGKANIVSEYIGENGEEIGELQVASRSVARGYYKNDRLTKERFYENEDGVMGYKTGDLVYEDNGLIYYVGRKDFQIKLHGLRIELNDIESNLNKLAYISGSVVLPVYKDGKPDYLAAFVTLNEEQSESAIRFAMRVKNDLKEMIPVYMVPKKVTVVQEFPLNVNGKIDRKKLLEDC